jgi:tetrahydromethanopterin S-methyltransferase subunit B
MSTAGQPESVETTPPESTRDAAYWKSRPIEERFAELERLREEYIRTLPPEKQKFQRVIAFINGKHVGPQD